MIILEVDGIEKMFSDRSILKNIDFNVPENTIMGFLGPNGAGKTTLIRILTKIINADSGKIMFKGKPLTKDMVYQLGYMPEERGL
ncbi:MAG: ATP-binding cassette domain-containing protein, partial [bacterium]|nr:ATP-binding cassette domain-containing protein [bacterium]